MPVNILIIGFGSIGQRHYEILKKNKDIKSIDVVSKRNATKLDQECFLELDEIEDLSFYDYFIISNETSQHFNTLNSLNRMLRNKKILVEKPIFEKLESKIELQNEVYVAYNLRYHPAIVKLRDYLSTKQTLFVSIHAGQYLPQWRPEADYRKSYSAKKKFGGGVLRDLSHELDYARWLFGDFTAQYQINDKISDLEIETDDIFTMLAKTDKKTILNITMDYISKIPLRRIIAHTNVETIEIDLIKNSMIVSKEGNVEEIYFETLERDYTYDAMHKDILTRVPLNVCTYDEGIKTVKLFDNKILKEEV